MLSYEIIERDTQWVGKFYTGGRIKGTYKELAPMMDEFRDLDICCQEGQPEHLKEFYEGYFNQHEYYLLSEYYHNVYAR